MFYKKNFSDILKKIYKTYPNQRAFADAAGVNRAYLSQYINLKLDNPPSPKILAGIANSSRGITTYLELMQICGYTDLTDSFFELSIKQDKNQIPVVSHIYFHDNIPVVDFYGTVNEIYINANFELDEDKEYFAFKYNSNSMLPLLGMGDFAIIEKTNTFRNGQICLFTIDNKDIMIRKIIDFKDYIELHTTLPYKQPIKLTKEEMKERNFTILGRIIKVENTSAFR